MKPGNDRSATEAANTRADLLPPMGIRNDRDMLNYLMQAFDSEMSVCERCHHEESTATCDSAGFLREYLADSRATFTDADRELLELAAKAAGLRLYWANEKSHFRVECEPGRDEWNPLTDDGDALRLAVELRISILSNIIRIETGSIQLTLAGIFIHECTMKQDMGVATRRAIVRAAAEIGRAMP